jgi:hypothetical protein
MKLLWNRVGDVGIALGNALGPAINLTIRGLNALIPVLEQMVGVFNALPASVQLGIIGFAGLVAAAGPAIYVFGQLALATSAVTAAFTAKGLASRLLLADLGFLGTALRANIVAAMATVTSYGAMGAASITMTTAARALGTAILALPWAAATAGAAALAAGLVYLYARAKDAALAAETQGAKQDAINRALEHGAAANAEYAAATDKYAAAVKFNTEWEEKRINAYNRAHRGANSLTDAQQQLNAANAKYNQELKGIEGALAFQIRHMAETGKTAKDLAAEFHISELTVTRYTTALRDNAGATDENNKGKKKALELTSQQVQAMNLLDQAHAHQTAALNLETAAWERWQQVVSKTLSNLPKGRLTEGATGLDPKSLYTPDSPFTIPVRLDILGPTGLDPSKINMGGIEKTGIGGLVGGSGGGLFSKLFGSTEQFGQQMASTIMGAVQGGGNPVTAAAGMVGSKIGSGIAGLLKSDGTKMFTGALGGIFSATLPVIGSLIGPLAGAIWNKLFGTAGRDAVKDFVAGFGGFDAFHAMLGKELPADAERLWIALTQGVGRNNPAEAKKIIDEITAALARKKEQTVEAAQASAAAAVAQQEELDAISAKYSESISKLDEEYKTLSDSVAKEAEEEFMGLTEIHERERMKQIEAEKAAKKQERDAAIQIKQEEFDALLEAGRIADEELRKIFEKGYRSPVRFDFPDGIPGGGAIPSSALPSGYSSGGAGSFDRTASRTSASSGQPVNVKIPLYLDQFGQAKIAEANAKVYVGG